GVGHGGASSGQGSGSVSARGWSHLPPGTRWLHVALTPVVPRGAVPLPVGPENRPRRDAAGNATSGGRRHTGIVVGSAARGSEARPSRNNRSDRVPPPVDKGRGGIARFQGGPRP